MKNVWILRGKVREFETYLSAMVFGIKFSDLDQATNFVQNIYNQNNLLVQQLIKYGITDVYLSWKLSDTWEIVDIQVKVI